MISRSLVVLIIGSFLLFLPFSPIFFSIWEQKRSIREAQEKYPIVGYRYPERLVEKVITFNASCTEEFSGKTVTDKKMNQVWDRYPNGEIKLGNERNLIYLDPRVTFIDFSFDFDGKAREKYYGFDPNKKPFVCRPDYEFPNISEIREGQLFEFRGVCERRELVKKLLSNIYGNIKIFDGPSGGLPFRNLPFSEAQSAIEVRKNFKAVCEVLVVSVEDCFNTENDITQRLIEYRDEEERCEHPDHIEFKKEVLRKWADIGPNMSDIDVFRQ